MKRLIFEPEHEQLHETTRQYIEREVAPNAEKWELRPYCRLPGVRRSRQTTEIMKDIVGRDRGV